MNINADIGAGQIVNDRRAYHLHHRAVLCTGKHTVHIEVKHRYASRYAVDPHRIQRGINIKNTVEQLYMLVYVAADHVSEILPLQLVSVSARHKAETCFAFAVLYALLLYIQIFVYRKRNAYYCFNHWYHSFHDITLRTNCNCLVYFPNMMPLSIAQSRKSLPCEITR